MTVFKITVDNQSGKPFNYLLFKESPKVDNKDESLIFANVAASSGDTPSPATATFKVEQDYYGVCGSSPTAPLGSGVDVSSVQTTQTPVTIGTVTIPAATELFMSAIGGGPSGPQGAEFVPSKQASEDVPGGFAIQTDTNYDAENSSHIFAGIGSTANGSMVALSTFEADPNTNYMIFPHPTFYIGTGSFDVGIIADKKAVGASTTIDFTGGFVNAHLIHNPNLTYTVSVS